MWSRNITAFSYFLISIQFLPSCLAGHFEHVILADCVSTTYSPNITYLSQMAYYSSTLKPIPDTVTVIPTKWNTTVPWFNTTHTNKFLRSSAVFPDGTVFNLTLTNRSSVQDTKGGIGDNGWAEFTCWRYPAAGLYSWYSNVWCDGVYDCNHQDRGGDQGSPNATATATATATPSAPTASSTGDGGMEHRDARHSDAIALGLGLGIGLPSTVAAIVGLWYANRQWNLARVLHLHHGPTMNERPSSLMEMNHAGGVGVEESSRGSGDDAMVPGEEDGPRDVHDQYPAR
ncbi:hypothetical protein BDV96DRAFT_604825 [Lophiotrema nucula]|uniref:Mid2 domain-containing protein n=1 Tax=Lophiotrema nucula TaxID=690887 RepID=A0A6A5YR50_9PLEO|nr:hypothetical protein BDV96DRAFT_604825 [Lophiotrema nucula]